MSWLAALLLLAAISGTADAQSTIAPAGDPAAASVITPAGQPADQPDDTDAYLTPSIEDLLASGEIIEIWDERPAKPFERDTKLRLTGEELARRGVTNLADALELIPEINVRDAGRGGRQIDIRGARKGSVKILIDGIPVGDPYYGNFDVSSIPVTDIVEVRVSAAPASPIDGSGGPGGVVEVHTRDAVGPRLLSARADASSLPDGLLSASSRTMLSTSWAIRISATGTLGARNLGVVMPGGARGVLDEDRRSAGSASRLEYRSGSRRIALDLTADHGSYLVPPSEDEASRVLSVDGATAGRAGLVVEDQLAAWRLQARGYGQASVRDSTYYTDATMTETTSSEHLIARRFGGGLLFNRAIGDHLHVLGSAVLDSESGESVNMTGTSVGGSASISEVAGGARFVRGRVDINGSAGLAVPIGIDAAPWPEAKLSAQYRFARRAAVKVIGGHKGRLPTLRERFESNFGNESLGPEKAWYAEAALTVDRNRFFEADIAGYIRPSSGMIKIGGDRNMLINTGALTIRGIDARVTLLPEEAVSAGALAGVLRAHSAEQGDDPIDRLPDSYGELWMAVRLGSFGGGRVRARYTGEQVDKDETLPGHSTVDISTYWHMTRALVGTVRVDNLLDNRYLDRAGGIVAVGRVVTLSLQTTWK